MSTERPLVSIVVRTKDRPKLVKEALKSICAQTYRPLEVVLVNDGGSLPEQGTLSQLLEDVAFKVLHLPANAGRAEAANAGIGAAAGLYLGFLDDDDRFLPDHVALLAECLEGGDHRICYADAELCHRRFNTSKACFELEDCYVFTSRDFYFPDLLLENYIPLHCLLFERELLLSQGGFDTYFDLYEDWDLLLRLGSAHPFYHIPRVTAQYIQWSRELQVAQTEATHELRTENYQKIIEKHQALFTPKVTRHLLDTRNELEQARQRLARLGSELATAKSLLQQTQAMFAAKAEATHQDLIELKQKLSTLDERESELALIKASRAWRLVQVYSRTKQALLTPVSNPRRLARKFLRSMTILRTEGWRGFLRRFNRAVVLTAAPAQHAPYPYIPIEESEVSLDAVQGQLDTSISVIIPTQNAGEEFGWTLQKLARQWGVKHVELLVVDSGSSDQTVNLARRWGAKVIEIDPASFHHAETRNLAAQHAAGEVLVFTVQDAAPASADWLYRLVRPLLEGRADAVTVRQIPRPDADLFAYWNTWGFFTWLGFPDDHVRNSADYPDFAEMDPVDCRRIIHLDNVCTAISKPLFSRFQFQGAYGEDLDLGKRLIQAGCKLMYQSTNAVVHSHTRPPVYFFKRCLVDTVFLSRILALPRGGVSMAESLAAVAWFYQVFCERLEAWLECWDTPNRRPTVALAELVDGLRWALRKNPVNGQALSDKEFFCLLQPFMGSETPAAELLQSFEQHLYGDLYSLAKYLEPYADWPISSWDARMSLHKFFTAAAGRFAAVSGAELTPAMTRGI